MWYHPNGSRCGKKSAGSIEYRLEWLRKEEGLTSQKRRKNQEVVEEDVDSSKTQMCSLPVNDDNKAEIKNLLAATLKQRDKLRKQTVSAAQIIKEFPRLIEYAGEMVCEIVYLNFLSLIINFFNSYNSYCTNTRCCIL